MPPVLTGGIAVPFGVVVGRRADLNSRTRILFGGRARSGLQNQPAKRSLFTPLLTVCKFLLTL